MNNELTQKTSQVFNTAKQNVASFSISPIMPWLKLFKTDLNATYFSPIKMIFQSIQSLFNSPTNQTIEFPIKSASQDTKSDSALAKMLQATQHFAKYYILPLLLPITALTGSIAHSLLQFGETCSTPITKKIDELKNKKNVGNTSYLFPSSSVTKENSASEVILDNNSTAKIQKLVGKSNPTIPANDVSKEIPNDIINELSKITAKNLPMIEDELIQVEENHQQRSFGI